MISPRSTLHDSRTLLPKPMTALDPKSWAYESITRRWPEIARRIFIENELPLSIKPRLEALIADIPDSCIRFIDDPDSPDAKNWNRVIGDHLEKNWLEPPWFFTEHYFYRRVIEAIGYFQNGDGHRLDPFVLQKKQGLELSRTAIRDLVSRGVNWTRLGGDRETLKQLLYLDLWGNQADLSMWPVDGESKPDHSDLEKANAFLLEDRAAEIADYFFALPPYPTGRGADGESVRIDFIIDNAGFELVSDLVFADYLVSSGLASVVRFHVKPHPTYVSDATVKDVRSTLDFFQMDDDAKVKAMGVRLADYWDQSKLQVRENFFWTSSLPGWDLPSPLKKELSESHLVISKGDANYRRFLGDLEWPLETPFADILAYFPTPIVALRTVKAEIACGMQPGQVESVAAQDPDWMVDGRWGVAQFCRPETADR